MPSRKEDYVIMGDLQITAPRTARGRERRPLRTPARGSAFAVLPTAPERTPIREIPIYDVERKRFGEFTSSSAERARLSPASARCLRSALRVETNAVSDMDKQDAGPPSEECHKRAGSCGR
jgi:hypothetical protein